MIQDALRKIILKAIKTSYPKTKLIVLDDIKLERPKNPEYGDYSTNLAMFLGGLLGKYRLENAELIVKNLPKNYFIEKVKIAGPGFINFFLKQDVYQKELQRILKEKENFGNSYLFKDKKVQVEFISANPTGPLTLANGRGGFSGDVLANVFKKAGAEIEKEYYINDGGNQVKILGESILVAAKLMPQKKELYCGEHIEKWAKGHKKEIEKYKDEPLKLGQLAAKDFLKKFIKPAVSKMNIKFDDWFSEKDLVERDEVEKALEYFKKKGLTYKKAGALWFKTTKFGDDKDRVLIKSDGEKTYFANDTAYHWDKFAKRKFDRVVDIWGADHHGYVARIKAVAEAMGAGEKLDIIIMQLVGLIKDGKEFKMSKRKGAYVTVDDLLELIGGSEREASDVARFFFLSRDFNTHMDFDLDLAREHSEKNPVFYVKYAYARIHGILAKSPPKADQPEAEKLGLLKEPEEIALIKELIKLPEIIEEILKSKDYSVNYLTFYARDIAKKFHNFYEHCRVIDEKNLELTSARLKLVEATKIVLGIVMRDLLGIETPERM